MRGEVGFVVVSSAVFISSISFVYILLVGSFPINCRFEDDGNDTPVCPLVTCGEITTCGSLGKICGGYDTKGRNDDIVFSHLVPAGDDHTYYVTMDFIKIDGWFVL